jgi:hypothetical protein
MPDLPSREELKDVSTAQLVPLLDRLVDELKNRPNVGAAKLHDAFLLALAH